MIDSALTQGLIAGLFALLGAFFGSALVRRTEYEKWLRQERTEAFGTFIRELHETRSYAGIAYYEEPGTEQEKSIKVTSAFTKLQKHAGIARLFMSETARKQFSQLLNDLCMNCTVQGGPANKAMQIKGLMEKIQTIMESQLNYLPSSVGRLFK